ncbi:MAG: metallophosphoesterase [Candidatus Bipolaricaulota bacterium]|nr:metallophosphoesterase [Candidatus Bipolaricaulota bacterium]MCX7844317.1 metallophosphoesterase [Candidatus Bipolaricaulota bacterium]MDW8152545.1 metallophosphoesterase [Candidatus Bipolaricaulota bacterium]
MRIGVVSDSHDHLANLRRALALLRERGAELVLHAGDFVSPFVAEPFREAGLRVVGVFGNNDGDRLHLRERFAGVGELHVGPHELELGGRRILLMHEPRALEALAASGKYDLVVYGHTHRAEVREGRPLVLNPGELGGWLTGRATLALVDLALLRAELLAL